MVRASLTLGLACFATACGVTPQGTAKVRAANDFQCSEDAVTLTNIGGTSYRAQGCGKSAVYTCAVSDAYNGSARNYACVPESAPAAVK